MKSLALLTLIVNLVVLTQPVSAQIQGPTTDLAQLKIKMVYANRDSFLRPCATASTVCGLSSTEISAVNDILAKSPQFMGLDVASATENPGVFAKDANGQFPLYSSNGPVGSHIYLNRDRLRDAPFKAGGGIEIYVESLLSYFFFQQTHQLAPSDLLARKIALFWSQLFRTVGLAEFKEDKIELLVFKHSEVRILLLDSFEAFVLNPFLLKNLKCDEGFLPGMITNFSTLAWMKYQASNLGSKAGMHAAITYQCVNSKAEKQNWTADMNVDFDFIGAEKKKWNSTNLLVKVNGTNKAVLP